MLAIECHRAGFEQVHNAKEAVDFVQVIHFVIDPDYLTQLLRARRYQTIVGLTVRQRQDTDTRIQRIEHVGNRRTTAPGVITHAIHQAGAAAATGGRHAGRIFGVEFGQTGGGQAIECGNGVLAQAAGASGKGQQAGKGVGNLGRHGLGHSASRRDFAHDISNFRALVDAADAGDGSHQIRTHRSHITCGWRALAVADDIDLGSAGGSKNALHFSQQLLAPHFIAVGSRNGADKHFRAVFAQFAGDFVEIVCAEKIVEAENAVYQHNRIFGLGIANGKRRLTQCQRARNGARPQQQGAFHGDSPRLYVFELILAWFCH